MAGLAADQTDANGGPARGGRRMGCPTGMEVVRDEHGTNARWAEVSRGALAGVSGLVGPGDLFLLRDRELISEVGLTTAFFLVLVALALVGVASLWFAFAMGQRHGRQLAFKVLSR